MVNVTTTGQAGVEIAPTLYRVYHTSLKPRQFEWIIEGVDGDFYLVPDEAGGWLRRSKYHGQVEKLKAISQTEARSICWMVYGDVGRVTMEGSNLEPR
jgi:hypothetical protein